MSNLRRNAAKRRLRRRGWQALRRIWSVFGSLLLVNAVLVEMTSMRAAELPAVPGQPPSGLGPSKFLKILGKSKHPIFQTEFVCKTDRVKGVGCSAGCATASFPLPLIHLTVILLSIQGDDDTHSGPHMLYCLAQLPGNRRAEGFVLEHNFIVRYGEYGTHVFQAVPCTGHF
jgi:hypothetical protein